jgi:hypothetical protein
MDMLQCAFTLSENEAAEGVILDDEAVMERLRSMENIRKMSWTNVLRSVMTVSAMSPTHPGAGGGHRAAYGPSRWWCRFWRWVWATRLAPDC